jgi:hypothetical protein
VMVIDRKSGCRIVNTLVRILISLPMCFCWFSVCWYLPSTYRTRVITLSRYSSAGSGPWVSWAYSGLNSIFSISLFHHSSPD